MVAVREPKVDTDLVRWQGWARSLVVVGGAAVLVTPLLIAMVGGRGVDEYGDAAVLAPALFLAGAVAGWRRPGNRAARWLLYTGVLIPSSHALALIPAVVDVGPAGWVLNLGSRVLIGLGFAAWGTLYAVFPDGTCERRSERLFTRSALVVGVLVPVLGFFSAPVQPLIYVREQPATPVPLVVPALVPVQSVYAVMFAAPVVGIAFLVLRYRRATAPQRATMRWPLASAVAVGFALATTPLITWVAGETVQTVFFLVAAATLPLALVVGMARNRLLDVDLVIRRSAVFGVLWLAITLVYATVTAVPGIVIGQRFPVGVAVVVTIAVAMATASARRRLERLADRVVFGRRQSQYDALRDLGQSLEGADETEQLAAVVASSTRAALRASWVRVTLDNPRGPLIAAAGTVVEPAALVEAVGYAGESYGLLECGAPTAGGYDGASTELVASLGRQAGLAMHAGALAATLRDRLSELAASRARIVSAGLEERRRIERDLHDGVQQQLVALAAKVDLARLQLGQEGGPHPQVAATLAEAARFVQETHVDLRELVRGIHPSVLSDQGLVEAIKARAATLPLSVAVHAEAGLASRRFTPDVEAAAYFSAVEALTNAAKHAQAGRAVVSLRHTDCGLQVTVSDDGRGFTVGETTQSGLRGMADRLNAVGGALAVHTVPGGGTCLDIRVPVPTGAGP